MTGPHPIEDAVSEVVHEVTDEIVKIAKDRRARPWILIITLGVVLLLSGSWLATRFGVLLPQGRLMI